MRRAVRVLHRRSLLGTALGITIAVCGCARPEASAERNRPDDHSSSDAEGETGRMRRKSRTFWFLYGATITGLEPGATARVWIPLARTNSDQRVEIEGIKVPGEHTITTEPEYGNKLLYFEAAADEQGRIPVDIEYRVERSEITFSTAGRASGDLKKFLAPSALVPVDGETARLLLAARLSNGDTLQKARLLYDAVEAHMSYNKSKPGWGRGDVKWACDSRFGNCTDFHSVFIAACRDLKVPGRFEIGFALPDDTSAGEIGGYHCWAKFVSNGRWVPVDISEADKNPEMKEYYFGNLTADRIQFTTGRDLLLEPKQETGPVNFLVYPHVEVAGKPHTQFERRFRFADLADL